MSLIPECSLSMAESGRDTEIRPYQFEPLVDSDHSDYEDDMSESETDSREQESFME